MERNCTEKISQRKDVSHGYMYMDNKNSKIEKLYSLLILFI